jgi:hypothetical protein
MIGRTFEKTCKKCVYWKEYGMFGWKDGGCYYHKFPMWAGLKDNSPKTMNGGTNAEDCLCFTEPGIEKVDNDNE